MTYIFTNRLSHKANWLTKLLNKSSLVAILFLTSISYSQTATAPAGAGTIGDPYQIASLENLYWITATDAVVASPNRATRWTRYYIQTADIDASASSGWDSGNGWTPIGNNSTKFTGSYDGDGHIIDNLHISKGSTDYVGLFGYINSGAVVKNIGVINANITGQFSVGGLVGLNNNNSTVSNSYSTGSVSGSSYVGGLVGQNNSSTVSNSYSTGSVSGTNVGGLVGYNNSSIVSNSYSTGSVSGTYSGGLVGLNNNYSAVSNSYSTGSVSGGSFLGGLVGIQQGFSTVTNSFWDTQTSGRSTSNGGTGKTTAEMKTQSTFTNAGWDFIIEITNGTNDYWEMNSAFHSGYPILSWQSVEAAGITDTPTIISNSNIGFTAFSGSVSLNFVEMNKTPSNLPGGAVTINKYWEISDITGGSVKLRLYYLTSLASSFSGNPTIIHYNGSNWEILPTEAPVTVGSLTYVETTNYYSSFSPVSVGDDASPLPVELVSFTGELVDNSVVLYWETATEVNNYGFEIQKSEASSQNSEWKTIGFVQGNGTTNSPKNYEFTDSELPNSEEVSYRLKQIDNDGTFAYSKIVTLDLTTITDVDDEGIVHEFALNQNYPNPFNPSTTINFTVPSDVKRETSNVKLIVYDILGKEMAVLVNQQMQPGNHEVSFNADNFSSGMYFYKLTTGNFVQTKKMLLIK